MKFPRVLSLAASFALIATTGGLASGAAPPAFVTQQQDRAVHAYCAEWRKTHGKLNADEMNRRVVTRLQEQYPTVFPECRPDRLESCLGWINALVEGLRRYGPESLKSVCSGFQDDPKACGWRLLFGGTSITVRRVAAASACSGTPTSVVAPKMNAPWRRAERCPQDAGWQADKGAEKALGRYTLDQESSPRWSTTVLAKGLEYSLSRVTTLPCEATSVAAPIETSKVKILLVDDDRDVRQAMSLLLENEGFTVLTAQNGLDALDQLNTERHISLILLDLWMPVMNGWEFLRQKSQAVAFADIPVIAVSAVPLSGSPDGTDALLRKPVNPMLLIEAIKQRLG